MDIVYTPRHKLHATDRVEVECCPFVTEELPERAQVILDALCNAGLGRVVAPVDHGLGPINAVHDAGFVDFLQHAYANSIAHFGEAGPVFTWTFATRHTGRRPEGFLGQKGYYALGWGSPILEGTWEAAYWSAQCALTAADLVRAGQAVIYALCRPPGHHAAIDLYGGFCYLNNAAIAARYLQQTGERVAILDIDYHHGNGTQSVFYSDPSVFFCSLHAHPDDDFPYYWGASDERGAGAGDGTNRNFPLAQGTDDSVYLAALEAALALIQGFRPAYLIVSAGFDTIAGDPVGGFCLTQDGLRSIGTRIAEQNTPTLIVQEGGYMLERLGDDVCAFLQAFI